MPINKNNLGFWRILTNIWGFLTLILFVMDFFSFHSYDQATSACAVIYGFTLALYVGSKEFQRWNSQKGQYKSIYFGEIYPIIWTITMIAFVIIRALFQGNYLIPSEFPTTYITVLAIYIISQQSKAFYIKN